MKKLVLLFVASLILSISSGFAQNRFENVNPDSVDYIIIKYQEEPGKMESKKITDSGKIKEVVGFLKQTEFDNYVKGDARPNHEKYIFWINLSGWFEKIYFFKDDAFIAKSQYNIDPKVIDKLKELYKKL